MVCNSRDVKLGWCMRGLYIQMVFISFKLDDSNSTGLLPQMMSLCQKTRMVNIFENKTFLTVFISISPES